MIEWDKVVYLPPVPCGSAGEQRIEARIALHAALVMPEEVARYFDDKEKRARLRGKIAVGIYGEAQDAIKALAADLHWLNKQPLQQDALHTAIDAVVARLVDLADTMNAPHAAGENFKPVYAEAHWPKPRKGDRT